MPSFSKASMDQLNTCELPLRSIMLEVVKVLDISALKGHRNEQEQNAAFDEGTSQLRWPHGKHNRLPSRAVDICPYHKTYGRLIGTKDQLEAIARAEHITTREALALIREHYCVMQGVVLAVAHMLGYTVRLGMDWDSDRDLFDNDFDDLGHVELVQ